MEAEHKGNMRENFYFPTFCNFQPNGYIPQLRNWKKKQQQQQQNETNKQQQQWSNYILIEQEMKIISF